MSDAIDINELSRATGVSVRTIRYYLAEGLLSSPHGRGPTASYSLKHVNQLRLIRRLQAARHSLHDIGTRLKGLDEAGVTRALAKLDGTPTDPPRSASDYVRQVMADAARGASAPPSPSTALRGEGSPAPERSTWERIIVHPGIELHVRRPLARADQRRLDTLLEQAKQLFSRDD